MAVTKEEYENIRAKVIDQYRVIYKDSVAMDACQVPKEIRLRLFEDPVYIAQTKAIKAGLFSDQLRYLDKVLAGAYAEEGKDQSATILKAIEMKSKLLLEDLNVIKDDSNAVNIVYMALDREDFEALDTVEVHEGSNNDTELGADFAVGDDDNSSFEARMKADVQKKMSELGEDN